MEEGKRMIKRSPFKVVDNLGTEEQEQEKYRIKIEAEEKAKGENKD